MSFSNSLEGVYSECVAFAYLHDLKMSDYHADRGGPADLAEATLPYDFQELETVDSQRTLRSYQQSRGENRKHPLAQV